MADELLSPAELESLLGGETPAAPAPEGRASQLELLGVPLQARDKVEPYDFRRPRRARPELLQSLAALDESLARTLAASLTTMLRSTVSVKLAAVDEQSYAEFIAALDNPSCACVLLPAPIERVGCSISARRFSIR